jgi:hypothetical protein
MTALEDAEIWADVGIIQAGVWDEYAQHPKAFEEIEVRALVRAAYAAGYLDAHGDVEPTPILSACQHSTALRLTLPL